MAIIKAKQVKAAAAAAQPLDMVQAAGSAKVVDLFDQKQKKNVSQKPTANRKLT